MISRRLFTGLIGSVAMMPGLAFGADMPAPFDNPGAVKIALVRYLSTGDFFQAYLSGVEKQAAALGVDLQVFDSRQDAALQAEPRDVGAMTQALQRALEDGAWRAAAIERGLARSGAYTWQGTAAALVDVLRKIAA